jgi:hypothetical protein
MTDPGAVPKRTREEYLAAPVAELTNLWLVVQCSGCPVLTKPPLKLMASQRPQLRAVRLSELLPRLKCTRCGARPSRVSITNFPAGPPQYADTWVLELLP